MAATPGVLARSGRADGVRILLLAAFVLLPFAGTRDLFDQDEGRYGAVAATMAASGDWVVPRLDGMVFLDKPPLVYWVAGGALRLGLDRELAARTPTLVAGCLWALLVFLLARAWTGRSRPAVLAALLAVTSAAGILGSRYGPQMDMPLAAAVTGALYAAWRRLERPTVANGIGLGVAVGVGLLTKGPLVVAVPGIVGLAWVVLGRVDLRRALGVLFSPWSWAVALAIAAPWVLAIERAEPGWVRHFIVHEHFGRFGEGDHRNFHPAWFYVPVLLVHLAPWTPMAWGASGRRGAARVLDLALASPFLPSVWQGALPAHAPIGRGGRPCSVGRLAWLAFLAAFLLYSASTRKLFNYLFPALAPLFVLLGVRLDRLLEEGRRLPYLGPLLLGAGAVIAGGLVAAGRFFPFATGALDVAVEAPRYAGLGPPWIGAGLLLVAAALTAALGRSGPRVRAGVLLAGVTVFWWGADLGLARIGGVASARALAGRLAEEVAAGRRPIALKRYPQGLAFYGGPDLPIAGGEPGAWWQREIVEPYATRAWEAARSAGPGPDTRGGLLTTKAFEALWASPAPVALVCRAGEIAPLGGHVLAGPFGGAGRTDLYVVTNRAPAD